MQPPQKGVRCVHGRAALRPLVEAADALVCLLPLTPETAGIVDAELLSWLPRGAAVINGARGAHVVEADLLAALDGGRVGFALLDVFAVEPLPAESPLWRHPRVRLTPHVASMTTLEVRRLAAAGRGKQRGVRRGSRSQGTFQTNSPSPPFFTHNTHHTPYTAHCKQSAADQIAANYRSVVAGNGPLAANLVDRAAGY